MKRINLHFLAVLTTLIFFCVFSQKYGVETFVFFGFAENKEMEIRLENPVTIEAIHVTSGMNIEKGDLLLEVKRSGMALEQSDLNHEVASLQSQLMIWEAGIQGSLNRLRAQKRAKESEIKTQIAQLESEMSINKSLIEGLESIQPAKDNNGKSPNEIKIEGLKRDLKLVVNPLNAEIDKLTRELNAPNHPIKIQIRKRSDELGFVYQEEEELNIYAQSDGVIGNVFYKVGEQVQAYSTLLSFYEANPNQVKGYVLESLILNVNMGDSMVVQSNVHASYQCMGEVIGLGSRIVEIPERLRKNPTFKTYGREVQISIPSDNNFLQKEKVTLKLPTKKELLSQDGIIRAFISGTEIFGKIEANH